MKHIFAYIVFFAALMLAGTAAFFSVTGLAKLFAGSSVAIIVMASSLEFAKVVTVSFIYRFWKHTKTFMKIYLSIGVLTVMLITSAGIYGFLSNAYQSTATQLDIQKQTTTFLQSKQKVFIQEMRSDSLEQSKIEQRIQKLSDLRTVQESRIDTLQKKNRFQSAKQVETDIKEANAEIQGLRKQADSVGKQMGIMQDSVNNYNLSILGNSQKQSASEVGPLKYIAALTGKSMDSVANFFIMLLIFVFDPLAIALIIAANIAFDKRFETSESEKVEVIEKTTLDDKLFGKLKKIFKKKQAEPIESVPSGEVYEDTNLQNYITEEPQENSKEEKIEPVVEESIPILEPLVQPVPVILPETQKIFNMLKVTYSNNYMNFIEILFEEGKKKDGDALPEFSNFVSVLKASQIAYTLKEVKDFFTICVYFHITNMDSNPKKISKGYEETKKVFANLIA